jgi:urease accessory protein UreE
MKKETVIKKMKEIFKDVPYGIEHTLKVYNNAILIIDQENISDETKEIIYVTTLLHDIGAIEAQKKHNSMDGHYQELEGPPIAKNILEKCGYSQKFIERVCFIIGNHHTPAKIDEIDFKIQWDADLLENLAGMDIIKNKQKLLSYIDTNFTTEKGKKIAYERFYYTALNYND